MITTPDRQELATIESACKIGYISPVTHSVKLRDDLFAKVFSKYPPCGGRGFRLLLGLRFGAGVCLYNAFWCEMVNQAGDLFPLYCIEFAALLEVLHDIHSPRQAGAVPGVLLGGPYFLDIYKERPGIVFRCLFS